MESNVMAYVKIQANVDNRTPLTKIVGQFVVRLASGYDMDASITLPLTQYSVDLDLTQPQAKLIKYEVINKSQVQQEQLMVMNWIPYVAIQEWMPSTQPLGVFQIITKRPIWRFHAQLIPAQLVNVTVDIAGNDITGRDIDSIWSLNMADIQTKQAWQVIINYTPAREGLSGNFVYLTKPESTSYQQINGAQPMMQDLNIHDTFQQRVEKLNGSPARKMLSASVDVKNGAQLKKYELINMWSQQRSAPLKKINHQIVAMKSDSMEKKCLCSEVQLPILPRELPAVQMIRSAIPAVLTSQIYNGQCEPSAHAMTFKVEAKMTPERKELVSSSAAWPVYDMVNVELHKMRIEAPAVLEKAIDYSHRLFYPIIQGCSPPEL